MPGSIVIESGIPETWDAGHRVQVFSDLGSGTVDPGKPLLPRAVDVFPGQQPSKGFGGQPWGEGDFGSGRASRPVSGLERSSWGKTAWGTAPPIFDLPLRLPAAFGLWKFQLQAEDEQGRIQGAALVEIAAMVSAENPPPPYRLSLGSYDAGNDQVVLNFLLNTD